VEVTLMKEGARKWRPARGERSAVRTFDTPASARERIQF
jgi:hypothetical protein